MGLGDNNSPHHPISHVGAQATNSRHEPQWLKAGWDVSLSVVYFLILLLLLCVFEIILPLCEDHHSLTTSRNKERLGSANLQENYETSHTQI